MKSPREAFARYLGDGCPACAPKPRLDAARAIALIHGAGGVAGLAHPPFNLRESSLRVPRRLEPPRPSRFKDQSAPAPPATGSDLKPRPTASRLVGIGGSDFHAPNGPGRWVGFITTDPDQLKRLRDRRQPSTTDVSQCLPPNPPTDDRYSPVESNGAGIQLSGIESAAARFAFQETNPKSKSKMGSRESAKGRKWQSQACSNGSRRVLPRRRSFSISVRGSGGRWTSRSWTISRSG